MSGPTLKPSDHTAAFENTGCRRQPVKGTVKIEHVVDAKIDVLPDSNVIGKSGVEVERGT